MTILFFLFLSVCGLISSFFFIVPLFLLIYVYLFMPKAVLPVIIGLGFLWDLYWVVPLGLSGCIFVFFLLFLELYRKKYSVSNPIFLCGYLGLTTGIWLFWLNGTVRVIDVVLFVAGFAAILMHVRKKREMQKHFV